MNAVIIKASCRLCGRPLNLESDADCPPAFTNTLSTMIRCSECGAAPIRHGRIRRWWTWVCRLVGSAEAAGGKGGSV